MSNILSYNLDNLIHEEETKKFLQDMWNPLYGQGLYFSALHELGEHMYVPVKIKDQWLYASHALFDGFSLLDTLNLAYPELKLKYNINSIHPAPTLLSWPKAIFSALSSRPDEAHCFINQLPYDKEFNKEQLVFNIEFDTNETIALKNAHITSFLLEKLSKYFMKNLTTNQSSRWMVPVNVRQDVNRKMLSQMNASFVGVNCGTQDSPQDIKKQLISRLKAGEHWGYWATGQLGLMGGKNVIINQTIKSLNKKKSNWLAFFSNLGDIGGDISSPDFFIMPTVRWHRPIGCVCYIYRSKLNLNIGFHPSLNISNETLEDYKNEIYQSIVSTKN